MAVSPTLIAFHRFGLGAKPGGPARIGGARTALHAEVQTTNIAAIVNPNLPTYAKACFESQFDFERAEPIRQAEINARVDKQMSVEIGFVERLVIVLGQPFLHERQQDGHHPRDDRPMGARCRPPPCSRTLH